jgi:L-malate glycosyltransferase
LNTNAGKIRVFHLIKSLGRGGAEMLLPEGLRFADRERFEYGYGYFLPWKDAMVRSLEEQDVSVTCFGGRTNAQILLSTRRVAAHLRREGVDVLHCHMPVAGAVGRIAAKMVGIPVVYSEHNLQERFHPATRWLNQATWRWQERVIAVSGDVSDSIHSRLGTRVPVDVVLNGVDVNRFRRSDADGGSVRRQYGISDDAPVIGTVAVFRVQKRLEDWLTAARSLLDSHPEARFLLVGDGPLRGEVEAGLRAHRLEQAVFLPGLKEDVRPYLAAMDIDMMSSIFEGLPVALLEAMSMECVPVCTAVGGIPEVIRSGENGFLTEPEQPEQLARAAGDLIGDRARMKVIASAARETVAERFSMKRMTGELEAIYLQAIQSYSSGASKQGNVSRSSREGSRSSRDQTTR